MIPIRDNVPRVSPPYAVVAIIVVNALVFLYAQTLNPGALTKLYHVFGVVPARFFHPDWATWAGYPDTIGWPLVTYMFLHGGWLHVIMNMLMLWIFGDNIEDVTGHGWFIMFYVLCGLVAVALQMGFDQTSHIPVVGASGAVAGIMGAYVTLYPHGRVTVLVPVVIIPLFFKVPSVLFLGIWFLTQLASAVYQQAQNAGGVAWWAHIGGFVAGVVLIRWFRRRGHCRYCYNPGTKDYDPES